MRHLHDHSSSTRMDDERLLLKRNHLEKLRQRKAAKPALNVEKSLLKKYQEDQRNEDDDYE